MPQGKGWGESSPGFWGLVPREGRGKGFRQTDRGTAAAPPAKNLVGMRIRPRQRCRNQNKSAPGSAGGLGCFLLQ